jgi:hypothetical protein
MGFMSIMLIVFGGFGVLVGGMFCVQNWGASSTPVPFTLEELESGRKPPNIHLSLGTHVALYDSAITAFLVKKGETTSQRGAKMNFAIYPIVSVDHPLANETTDDSGSDVFNVLVLSDRFYSAGEMPRAPRTEYSVNGLVLNGIRSVNLDEQHLIQSRYPNIDFSSVILLKQGQKPVPVVLRVGLIAAGIVFVLLGLAARSQNSQKPLSELTD